MFTGAVAWSQRLAGSCHLPPAESYQPAQRLAYLSGGGQSPAEVVDPLVKPPRVAVRGPQAARGAGRAMPCVCHMLSASSCRVIQKESSASQGSPMLTPWQTRQAGTPEVMVLGVRVHGD